MFVTNIDLFFTAAAGHDLIWTSPGRLPHKLPCRGDICIQGCYMYGKCARDKQSPYFTRISVRGSLQRLNSQAAPEKQDLFIDRALLRTAYRYVGSCHCSLCSPRLAWESAFLSVGGKTHLNTWPQVRRVSAGIISHPPESLEEVPDPHACLQVLQQHQADERKGKDS